MKKIIFVLIFAMAGLLFAGVQRVNAQANWSVTIIWNDDDCNCGPIESKYITNIELIKLPSTTLYSLPNPIDVTSNVNNIYIHSANSDYDVDCVNCYKVTATVEYNDIEGKCCEGKGSSIVSGTALSNGTATVYITME
jgi:hypothetical protein